MSDAITNNHHHLNQSTSSNQQQQSNACLTTYIFNPADSLVPSPERRDDSPTVGSHHHHHHHGPLYHHHHGQLRSHQHQVSNASTATVKSISPETLQLTLDRKSLGHFNYMAEYDTDLVVVGGGTGSGTVGNKLDNSFGPLYTISSQTTTTEERTYDEPCTGDLHRRSWLCCPGGETRAAVGTLGGVEPPPLLGNDGKNKDNGDVIIAAQPTQNGGRSNGFSRSPYERLQEQLDEQARSYEEQLTELHSVIAELTRKLHQQRSMAIQEEEEMLSDISTSVHDDSLTCPLEVSELDHGDLSDLENKRSNILHVESPLELPSPKLILPPPTHSPNLSYNPHVSPPILEILHINDPTTNMPSIAHIVDPLKAEILHLQKELAIANEKFTKLSAGAYTGSGGSSSISGEEEDQEDEVEDAKQEQKRGKRDDSEERQKKLRKPTRNTLIGFRDDLGLIIELEKVPETKLNPNDIKYGNIVPIHKTPTSHMLQNVKLPTDESTKNSPPHMAIISKIAARRRLKKTLDADVQQYNMQNSAINTSNQDTDDLNKEESMVKVVDNFVEDIIKQCDGENEKLAMQIEMARLRAKLEHSRAQNSVYLLTLSETKAHCDRLALLCGKYESNAVALRLALGVNDRAIEAYDVLLALLETELTMDDSTSISIDNRNSAETVAKQLLHYLDTMDNTDLLLSPWQCQMYTSHTIENQGPWTTNDENRLREHVSRLKAERSSIEGTCVSLESLQLECAPTKSSATIHEYRKFDMEMAVLIQELTYCREEKSELLSKMFLMEKEMNANELKLKYVEGQQKAQSAALKNLQGQLKDTEALLNIASQQKERGFSEAEHAEGVEKELVLALARESRLKVRLHELVSTLDQVTKNAEARLHEGREIVEDLRQNNARLADTVDKNNKKYQTKYKKMEQQMTCLVEKHTAQVQLLQQRLAYFENPTTKSSELENSIKSGVV